MPNRTEYSDRSRGHARHARSLLRGAVLATVVTVVVSVPMSVARTDAFGPCDPGGTPTLVDVESTNPFCDDVEWLVAQGITNGYPEPVATRARLFASA